MIAFPANVYGITVSSHANLYTPSFGRASPGFAGSISSVILLFVYAMVFSCSVKCEVSVMNSSFSKSFSLSAIFWGTSIYLRMFASRSFFSSSEISGSSSSLLDSAGLGDGTGEGAAAAAAPCGSIGGVLIFKYAI